MVSPVAAILDAVIALPDEIFNGIMRPDVPTLMLVPPTSMTRMRHIARCSSRRPCMVDHAYLH